MPRVARFVVLAWLLAACVAVLGAAASAQSTPAPATDPNMATLVYTGQTTWRSYPASGAGNEAQKRTDTFEIRCAGGLCRLWGPLLGGQSGEIAIADGRGSLSVAGSGSACARTYRHPITYRVTLTGRTLVVDQLQKGSGLQRCGAGRSVENWSARYVSTASYVSGAECALTGTCVPPPAPQAAGDDGGDEGAEGEPAVAAAGGHGGLDVGTPSTLSALPAAGDVVTVRNLMWAAAMTVVLVLLTAFPASLLNSASEVGSEKVSAWWAKRRGAKEAARPRTGLAWAAAGVLIAAVVSAFVSPDVSLDVGGLRVLASILVSFALEVGAGWLVIVWLVRRRVPAAQPSFSFAPLSLLVVAGAVLFSRVTGFEPGIVFGLVAGIAFASLTSVRDRARLTLVTVGWMFALGLVAWAVYSILGSGTAGGAAVFARETLAALAIGGMVALPLTLVPVRGMPGHDVFAWDRRVWLAAYAAGLVGFFAILMPLPSSWETVGFELWTWIGLYLAYALGAVTVWALVTKPWVSDPGPAEEVRG